MQEMWVQSLVQGTKDPPCCGATKSMSHNERAHTAPPPQKKKNQAQEGGQISPEKN